MNLDRKEYNKIYNKINKLAQKGSDYVFEYYILIDEIIANGQFSILEDVMITKYRIVVKNFLSIEDFKHFSFTEIRRLTNTNSADLIQKLLTQKSVYLVGYHLYDSITNHYLGDIREEETTNSLPYKDRKLIELSIDVYAEVGIPASISAAIPQFENNSILKINYKVGQQLAFTGNLYECTQSYTFSSTNLITPTFSAFWSQISSPTYSRVDITDDTLTLVQKYSQAIDFLKGFTYSYV